MKVVINWRLEELDKLLLNIFFSFFREKIVIFCFRMGSSTTMWSRDSNFHLKSIFPFLQFYYYNWDRRFSFSPPYSLFRFLFRNGKRVVVDFRWGASRSRRRRRTVRRVFVRYKVSLKETAIFGDCNLEVIYM